MLSRRRFLAASASAILAQRLRAQTARIDIARVEGERILADASKALATLSAGRSPGLGISLREVCSVATTLAAAFVLTKEETYARNALSIIEQELHLLNGELLNSPRMPQFQMSILPLAELAVAYRFLIDFMSEEQFSSVSALFKNVQGYLNTDSQMALERDRHDHRASAWLLLSSAIARFQRDKQTLDANRRLFRKPTLRNQIDSLGHFPEELATPNPYRNTLFNFDLLCGACQMLASPFDLLWDYELPDGPGMRSATALVYPVIQDRSKWPAISDAEHFRDLPGRRNGLLFAGRAYNRPEYVELWQSLSATIPAGLEASFPMREPLLWVQRAEHGY